MEATVSSWSWPNVQRIDEIDRDSALLPDFQGGLC